MDVRYLNYILTIAKNKNMTRAAKELFVSQSSLSQYLAKLEQELKTPLFYRSKGELNLTPAGKLYVEAAAQVVDIQKKLYRDISALKSGEHITVGATSLFALKMLSRIIPEFKKIYPGTSIEISENSPAALTKMLSEENVDLCIMAVTKNNPPAGQTEVLRTEEVLFAVPKTHPYCAIHPAGSMTAEELAAHFHDSQFLLAKKDSSLGILTEELFSSCRFHPSSMCETNSVLTMRDMVAHGVGVTFLGASCAVPDPNISYYSFNPPLTRYNVLVKRKNLAMNEAESCLCEMIRDYFRSDMETTD